MTLLRATMSRKDELCALYAAVCEGMNAAGITNWRWGEYPAEDMVEDDLRAGTLYCLEDESGIYAALTIDDTQPEEYADVNWLFGTHPGVFHRLAIRPDRQGQGVGRLVLHETEELLRAMGCDSLRCDTYIQNQRAQRLYSGNGMRSAGTIRLASRPLPFPCYEKPLTDACPLLPLRMTPAFRGGSLTPWGGDRLRTLYHKSIAETPTGESLEVSCIPGLCSRDATGEELPQLVARYGERFAGRYAARPFPLLLKLIDARESLSVQVHPDDAYAAAAEHGKLGKTEAWLILDAPEDGELVYGIREGVSLEQLKKACEKGDAVEPLLRRVRVKPGDVCFIPAGCVHAIGAGIMLYEIQQSSDVTYRFYDWNRVDAKGNRRELHLAKALDVTDLSFSLDPVPAPECAYARVLDEKYFTLDLYRVSGAQALAPVCDFALLTVLEGDVALTWQGGEMRLCAGESVYIPASAPALRLKGCGRAAVSMPSGGDA